MKIKAGDNVVVITGKDKGKTGAVLKVLPLKNRLVVAGISMRTKHIKKTPQRAGERVQYEGSIAASNVMLVDSKTKKRSRVGYVIDSKGKKKRVTKRSGEAIVKAAPPKKADTKADAQAEVKVAKETKKEKTAKPAGKPFWKKVGFGSDAVEDAAEVEKTPHSKEDHSVTDEGQASGRRSHGRGS